MLGAEDMQKWVSVDKTSVSKLSVTSRLNFSKHFAVEMLVAWSSLTSQPPALMNPNKLESLVASVSLQSPPGTLSSWQHLPGRVSLSEKCKLRPVGEERCPTPLNDEGVKMCVKMNGDGQERKRGKVWLLKERTETNQLMEVSVGRSRRPDLVMFKQRNGCAVISHRQHQLFESCFLWPLSNLNLWEFTRWAAVWAKHLHTI